MLRRNLACFVSLAVFSCSAFALDLDHTVSGDSEIEDTLGKSTEAGNSPYIINGESANSVENSKSNGTDFMFNHGVKEVSESVSPKKQFEDFGYTPPGAFEGQENYLEVDKLKMAKDYRKASSGSLNITFVKNSFDYLSEDDIIDRTISSGTKSIKGGFLYFRNDSYITKTNFLNLYWSLGAGVGYSAGRGIFRKTGERSDTLFKFWEVPVDLALGGEVPISTWLKFAGTAGPSAMAIAQNRSDYQRGEKGKRKYQFSPGYFANAQFKVNLTGFSPDMSYDLFTSSEITNLYMNLEIRHEKYANFQDDISISGTSFGIGFTFEYL
jgi:hypothetical protein